MRPPPFLIVLFASALAIEDLEREVEREALGAPGPTRANLRGRGLKFGHSVTEVEEEATDPPVPSPTFAATDPPAPAPTPEAGGGFADSLDCAADCPDCNVIDDPTPFSTFFPGYDFSTSAYNYNGMGICVCYVGPMKPYQENYRYMEFRGTDQGDCIAITELTNAQSGDVLYIIGEGGDDIIVGPTSAWGGVYVIGGDGSDDCRGGDADFACE